MNNKALSTNNTKKKEMELDLIINVPLELEEMNVDGISINNIGDGLYLSSEIKEIHIDFREPVKISNEFLIDEDEMSAKYDLDMDDELECTSIRCEYVGDSLSNLDVLVDETWFRCENIIETFLEMETTDIGTLLDTVYDKLMDNYIPIGGKYMIGTKFKINNIKVEVTEVKNINKSKTIDNVKDEKHLVILENEDSKFKIFVVGELTIEAIGKACLKTNLFI